MLCYYYSSYTTTTVHQRENNFPKGKLRGKQKPPTIEEVCQAQELYSPQKKRTVAQIKTRARTLLQVSR